MKFSSLHSPNTILNQNAVYRCTVDDDRVLIQWQLNGTSSTSSTNTNLGVVTEGAGTQNSTLIVPGKDILNGTLVKCLASGFVNDVWYFNNSTSQLFIQGIENLYL